MAMQYDFNVLIEKLRRGTLTAAETRALNEAAKNNPDLASVIRSHTRRSGFGAGATRQTLGVPGVGNLAERNGGGSASGRTISPGGFKKSGQDAASYARMRGDLTPDAVLANVTETVRKNRFGKIEKDGGLAFNGRNYSPSQIEWIKKRALTGATLSNAQQAIYDSVMSRERQAQEDAAAQKANEKAAETAQREWQQKLALAKQKSDLTLANQQANIRLRAELKAKQDEANRQAKADAKKAEDEAEQQAYREEYGIPDGVTISKNQRRLLDQGKITYGLSAADKRRKNEIDAELDRIIADENTSLEDMEAYYKRADGLKARFRSRYRDMAEDERTPQQIADSRKITVTDDMGRRHVGFWSDDNKFVKIADEKPEKPVEEKRKGMTFKDFVSLQPRKRTVKGDGVETKDTEVDIPLAERISAAQSEWDSFAPPPPSSDPATAQGQPQSPELTCPACGSTNIGANGVCIDCGFNLNTNQYERQETQDAPTGSDWTSSFGATRISE